MAKINEYRAQQRAWILGGGPADYAAYREAVGEERMIETLRGFCEEIEKEENE